MVRFQITKLVFSGGEEISLDEDSLILLVGPNSSGKSTALTNIEQCLHRPGSKGHLVVDSAMLDLEGEIDDFREWISANYPDTLKNFQKTYVTKGQSIADTALDADWKGQIGNVIHFLSHRLNTDERLQIVKPKARIERTADPSEYIHVLQVDTGLLEKISAEVRDSFKKDLIIHLGGGRQVWFHVGVEPPRDVENDRVSSTYLGALEKLPRIEEEGDGIKSFVGCLLGVMCGAHKVLMIDEPEAFLHPPQARKLGRLLADTAAERKRQVIAATHSPDVVIGALTSTKSVAVCRVERDKDKNHAYLLDSKQLSELWSRPLLQSTGAINGVFHKGVVVCEADSDCRFFEALLARIESTTKLNESPDLYFIHGGGKGAIDVLAKAYRSLNIKTVAIADFDVMRVKTEISQILSAFDTNLAPVAGDYNSAVAALNDLPPISSIAQFAAKATEIIESVVESNEITPATKSEFSELLSQSAKWSDAKKYGVNKLAGGTHTACKNVLDHCSAAGMFIIREGQLESFWREGPSTKSEWIIESVERINNDPGSFMEAEGFLKDVCAFFGYIEQA